VYNTCYTGPRARPARLRGRRFGARRAEKSVTVYRYAARTDAGTGRVNGTDGGNGAEHRTEMERTKLPRSRAPFERKRGHDCRRVCIWDGISRTIHNVRFPSDREYRRRRLVGTGYTFVGRVSFTDLVFVRPRFPISFTREPFTGTVNVTLSPPCNRDSHPRTFNHTGRSP